MVVSAWDRVGGAAAIIGGLMWVVKSGVILAGGAQPAYLFEMAPLAFAVALLALHARLRGAGGVLATTGWLVAVITGVAVALNIAAELIGQGAAISPLSGALYAVGGLGPPISLALIGWAGRLIAPPTWRPGPLVLAALYPLAAVGLAIIAAVTGMAATLSELLIEIPIMLIGLAWIALGFGLVRESSAEARFVPVGSPGG